MIPYDILTKPLVYSLMGTKIVTVLLQQTESLNLMYVCYAKPKAFLFATVRNRKLNAVPLVLFS